MVVLCELFKYIKVYNFVFRPEPSLALGAVAISSDNSKDSESAWLIPLVICFVIALCLLATAMLFYVKCYGVPNRTPKTTLINISSTRAQFIPSFAKNYSHNKSRKKTSQKKDKVNHLEFSLSSNQSHCQFANKNGFPTAELQILPTSSESNFASSSERRQSTLGQTESVGQIEEAKRLSQR